MTEIIVQVHRPELTPEERARRIEQIEDAAARLIIATETRKREQSTDNSDTHN